MQLISPYILLDYRIYLVIILPPMLGLVSIRSALHQTAVRHDIGLHYRNLKLLAPVSLLANLLQLLGLAITFYYLLSDLPPVADRQPTLVNTDQPIPTNLPPT